MRPFLSLLIAILLLSGCVAAPPPGPARFIQPTKPGGRLCAVQCREAFAHCEEGCALEQKACTNDLQAQAIRDYESHVREQFKSHRPPELRPSDFEKLESCEPALCMKTCRTGYRSCFESCGGSVEGGAEGSPLPFERTVR